MSDSDAVLSAPFDAVERYRTTARAISLAWPEGERSRPPDILDVGGHSGLLKHFLPQARVTVADVQGPPRFAYREDIPFRFDAYVRAAGDRLPVRDGSFDIVTAHDTLEHVPDAARADFVRELLRVARRFVIIIGPFLRSDVARAERRLERFIRATVGGEIGSLTEHVDLGLPPTTLVEDVLRDAGLPFVQFPSGDLVLWLLTMCLKHYVQSLPDGAATEERLDRTYNTVLASLDPGGPAYRAAFVIAVGPGDAAAVERVRADLRSPGDELAQASLDDIEPFLESLERQARAVRDHAAGQEARARQLDRQLGSMRAAFGRLSTELDRRTIELADRDAVIRDVRDRERDLEGQIHTLRKELERATGGAWYRLQHRLVGLLNRVAPWGTRRRSALLAPARAVQMIMTEGWGRFLLHLLKVWVWMPRLWQPAFPPVEQLLSSERYELWLRFQALSRKRMRAMRRELRSLTYRPTISIIMPTYNSRREWLGAASRSLRDQIYPNWELCVADDASTEAETIAMLRRIEGQNPRVKVKYRERNGGISAASNSALSLATGEFVGLIDHDDELKPNALFEVVKLLNEHRDLDFIYTDEDKKDPDGRPVDPFFKPAWSPDYLMSANYVTHFSVFRKEVLDQVGGFREGYEGSQDYDLALRVTEMTDRIEHIPAPAYSWRQVPGSAAGSTQAKPFAYDAAKRALGDALARRGHPGEILDGHSPGYYRTRYAIAGSPRVSIVIPARDRVNLLRRCVESVRERSTYSNIELVVVDNRSIMPETLAYLGALDARVLRYEDAFNLSKIVNAGAREATGDILVLLHSDTEVIERGWIEAMLEHVQRAEVAAAGARLLFPDGHPQHEGMVVGAGDGLARTIEGGTYFGLDRSVHNVSAVSGACLMTRTEVWGELGGFEERLSLVLADVDFCLRAREKGRNVVYTPYAALYHEQAASHSNVSHRKRELDEELFRSRWAGYRDPYYNPNLSLEDLYELRLDL